MNTSINLKTKSAEELAEWQESLQGSTKYELLAKEEWGRRARADQHELDLKLISKQIGAMRFAAILSSISVIVGAILGVVLSLILLK
jgi:hypothetical protein